MTNQEQLTFEEACDMVIEAAKKAAPDADIQYAASYAIAGKRMKEQKAREVQSLYILSNISSWRGAEAKRVREFFKNFSQSK